MVCLNNQLLKIRGSIISRYDLSRILPLFSYLKLPESFHVKRDISHTGVPAWKFPSMKSRPHLPKKTDKKTNKGRKSGVDGGDELGHLWEGPAKDRFPVCLKKNCCTCTCAVQLLTWLNPGGLEEVLQRLCVIVLVLEGVANVVPQLCVVFVNLRVMKLLFYK